jgi:hypothetical protein
MADAVGACDLHGLLHLIDRGDRVARRHVRSGELNVLATLRKILGTASNGTPSVQSLPGRRR